MTGEIGEQFRLDGREGTRQSLSAKKQGSTLLGPVSLEALGRMLLAYDI